jgi:hypothetical protein
MASSRRGNHNRNCATAAGHVCACTGCGGSLHGWELWVGLAKGSVRERRVKRKSLRETWEKYYKPRSKRSNVHVRGAVTDFARLEIADWLASESSHKAQVRLKNPFVRVGADPVSDGTMTRGETTGFQPRPSDSDENGPVAGADEPVELVALDARDKGTPLGDEPRPSRVEAEQLRPSQVEQVERLAEAMTDKNVWEEIFAELAVASTDPVEAARELANHGWCDLFIGLVQVVEKCRSVVDKIPEWGKRIVKDAIRASSKRGGRPLITDRVIDIVVEKVWAAFKGVAVANVPLLSLITREDAVRSLRILAVFSCPAPEDHDEVREHALKPLADEVPGILTDETKQRLAKLFKEWVTEEEAA